MAKCCCCGKFLSSSEAVSCSKCQSCYHRVCAGVKTAGPTTSWHCQGCIKSLVRDSRVRAPSPPPAGREEVLGDLMDTSPINSTALDLTQELNLDIIRGELANFKEEFLKLVRSEFQQLRVDLSELKSSLNVTATTN